MKAIKLHSAWNKSKLGATPETVRSFSSCYQPTQIYKSTYEESLKTFPIRWSVHTDKRPMCWQENNIQEMIIFSLLDSRNWRLALFRETVPLF